MKIVCHELRGKNCKMTQILYNIVTKKILTTSYKALNNRLKFRTLLIEYRKISKLYKPIILNLQKLYVHMST